VLTAAHCLNHLGFQLGDVPCETNADCPDLSSGIGNEFGIQCLPNPLSGELRCRESTGDTLLDVSPGHVRFGTSFSTRFLDEVEPSEQHVRKSSQILYCRSEAEHDSDETGTSPTDFAYCILAEPPNIDPISIIQPCEADLLVAGTEVWSVGFGQCDPASLPPGSTHKSSGWKRWAKTTLPADISAPAGTFYGSSWEWETGPAANCPAEVGADDTAGDADTGSEIQLAGGDSGGPLFAQMTDGTWRLVGIALTSSPGFVAVWDKIDWLLADENISEDDIIPCHDTAGQWSPGAACGATPTAPDAPTGTWASAPSACAGPTAARVDLCGAMAAGPPPSAFAAPPENAAATTTGGCNLGPSNDGRSGIGLFLVVLAAATGRKEAAR
jgi:hypothetical protein